MNLNPNIQLQSSIRDTVINNSNNYNLMNNSHHKINMRRNYIKLALFVVLLTIICFILSWYFLSINSSVNNISISITGVMIILLFYQIIRYIQMVKYYNKIAEDDYNTLRQILHERKENENGEWINMNDFVDSSILRHNLYRNDYNNNVLPRLRYLINNDVHIDENKENISNEIQVLWREI